MTLPPRTVIARTLRDYRRLRGIDRKAAAELLRWPLAFYLDVEAGRAGLSAGQVADVQRLFRAAIHNSAPADVHYRSFSHLCEDEERAVGRLTSECGSLPPGDTIADYRAPSSVTCIRCRLTPAWVAALRIYAKVEGRGR